MKKVLLLFLFTSFLLSCNSVKINQTLLDQGNYNDAIEVAVKKIRKDKTSSKSDAHIVLLEEAYKKAAEKDKASIAFYKKQQNPAEAQNTFYKYRDLIDRQNTIQQLLPLYSTSLQRNAKFKMENYSGKFAVARQNFSDYLYEIGETYMKFQTVLDYRNAYDSYKELTDISPNYKDSNVLLEEAHFKGTDFVLIQLFNKTHHIIPYTLESNLLRFDTNGLDKFWTEFHNQPQEFISYNYGVDLLFETIDISPERIVEEEFQLEKQIKDGWEYQKNRFGEFVLDKEGNKIKKDKYITVRATLYQTIQTKSAIINSSVFYSDFITEREIKRFPLTSEIIFENVFATYRGDKRALESDDLVHINNKFEYFPINDRMIFDAGEEIKSQLFEILNESSIR
ncbi:MAG: hypothetical protein L3J09_05645 [Flavobacteriaceae bacterium]|nr:hypothetical protein [Flavobacteriaceae bacterium]